jgi:hypothetical protein
MIIMILLQVKYLAVFFVTQVVIHTDLDGERTPKFHIPLSKKVSGRFHLCFIVLDFLKSYETSHFLHTNVRKNSPDTKSGKYSYDTFCRKQARVWREVARSENNKRW